MQVAQEVIDIGSALWTIFMIVGMLKYIAGDQRNAAPNSTIVMLIDQNVKKSL